MPRTFPYNWFTRNIRNVFSSRSFRAYVHGTRKYIKRQIFPKHMALLLRQRDKLTQNCCMLWVRKLCSLRICGPTVVVNGACGMSVVDTILKPNDDRKARIVMVNLLKYVNFVASC